MAVFTLERKTRFVTDLSLSQRSVERTRDPFSAVRALLFLSLFCSVSFAACFSFANKKRQQTAVFTLERKTRLELATPTLARLCSTN